MAGSPARKEVARVGVKVVPDTSGFGSDLKSVLAKHANTKLDIEVRGDITEFEADLKRITSGRHTVSIDVKADVAAAEAAINRVAQDRTSKLRLDVETSAIDAAIAKAQQSLSGLNSRRLTIKVDLDAVAAEAKLRLLTRTESKTIRVDLDTSSVERASNLISGLGSAITSALSGAASLVSGATSAFSALSNSAGQAATSVTSSGSVITGVLGNVSGLALQVVGSIAQIAGIAVVITGVITLLGSLVVAAGAAAMALAGVAIGIAGLVVLPALFAGIAASLISKSDELKATFGELGATLRATIQETAQPMLAALAEAIGRVNEAVSEGGPLYDGLALAFQSAAQAVAPLTAGLIGFAETALTGIANALENLNAQGFWDGIANGLATLGTAFGGFFESLSTWAPEFSASFQAVADAANILLPSLANLSGAFATFAPDVILGLAAAFTLLFDAFAANKDVYGAAAQALADALQRMAGPLEQVLAAFAQMAPAVLASIADAVTRFGEAVSNPEVISGLTNLATTIVNLGTLAATASTELAAKVGNDINELGRTWNVITGVLKESATVSSEHLRNLVDQAKGVSEAANNLTQQLNTSFRAMWSDLASGWHNVVQQWITGYKQMREAGNTEGAAMHEEFVGRLMALQGEIDTNGGRITEAWKQSMQKLIDETRASGGRLGESMATNMQQLLNAVTSGSEKNVEQVKAMLLGMENQTRASEIANLLGLKMDESAAKVGAGGQQIQQSFSKVLEALPEMVRNAKTPEELQTKLDQMTQIVSGAAPAMGTAFKTLGDSMVKGIADADVTAATTKLMASIQTAITSGVPGVVTAFQKLPTQLATTMATGSTGVTAAVTTQMTNITQAVTTGVTNAVTAYKKLPTDMASASNFSETNKKITEAMTKGKDTVSTNVSAMVKELDKLPTAGKEAGGLGGFASTIASEMSQAQREVSSGVRDILSQLEQLNRTFTTNIVVNIERNETEGSGGGGSGGEGPFSAPMALSPLGAEPVSALAVPLTAQADLAEQMESYARTLRGRRADAVERPTTQRIYNITINAAPNVPTEEQLRKQLSYADALYE
jgi:hypothetical protein